MLTYRFHFTSQALTIKPIQFELKTTRKQKKVGLCLHIKIILAVITTLLTRLLSVYTTRKCQVSLSDNFKSGITVVQV